MAMHGDRTDEGLLEKIARVGRAIPGFLCNLQVRVVLSRALGALYALGRSVKSILTMEALSDVLLEHKLPHTVWLLGVRYTLAPPPMGQRAESRETEQTVVDESQNFKLDMWSRLWFSYRYNFHPISGTELTTDTGWGCMIRSGQMLIGQALVHHHLGRDWRLSHTSK